MRLVTEINHSSILYKDDIKLFMAYYDDLAAEFNDEELDSVSRAFAADLLDEYDAERIEELRSMLDSDDDSFISEDHWDDYAAEYADEVLGIPDTIQPYFDYDKWSSDFRTDYTGYDYDGRTYYALS